VYEPPRELVQIAGSVAEPFRTQQRSFCCGAGGGRMFLGEEEGKRVNVERAEQLMGTGAPVVGAACPFCNTMFRAAFSDVPDAPRLLDVAQIAASGLPKNGSQVNADEPR
jgi:Fe-S oxidoreductase